MLVLVVSAAAATEDPAMRWSRVASGGMTSSEQVGLARTADGVLHVAWRRGQGNDNELLHTAVSQSGKIAAPQAIVTGWADVGSPALVARANQLSLFFPGTPTTTTGEPRNGLDLATSANAGRTWTVAPAAVYTTDFAGARTPSAVNVGSTFLQAWYATRETVVHAGLDPNVPAERGYGARGTNQALAAAGSKAYVAWCDVGVWVQPVDPASGKPGGAAARMPGTAAGGGFCPAEHRVQLVARAGQFHVAAEDATRRAVLVWRVGAGNPARVAAGPSFKQHIAGASATGDSRLWVGWHDASSGKLSFRRSNPAGTVWGAVVSIAAPAGQSAYGLDLNAQRDRADAILRTKASSNEVSLFHSQVFPGLTVRATSSEGKATVRVTDAGDPVSGATLRIGGRSLTTDKRGVVLVELAAGSYPVLASKPKYVGARGAVRVRG